MEPKEFLKNKKVLVVILGIYGGGAATAKWLFQNGAEVTVTDMRTEAELANSMKLFTPEERKGIRFILGGQREEDFVSNDIIVIGPGVPQDSAYLAAARKAGKQIENDASLFFRFVKNPVIAVTGTRGKSTTTSWLTHLFGEKYGRFIPTGNNPEHAFLKELSEIKDESRPVVAEMSSWQLETLGASQRAPHIAVITNLFPDHLNRYKEGIEGYARAKSSIFTYQTENDYLILNDANPWTKFFLNQKPKSKIFYFSKKPLAKGKNGMFVKDGEMMFRNGKEEKKILSVKKFSEKMGEHNLENFLSTALAIVLYDPKWKFTKKLVDSLPQIPFRQEIIFSKAGLIVVNDSAGTSPDATIAILRRFSKTSSFRTASRNPRSSLFTVDPVSRHGMTNGILLITGGTDKDLEFKELAKEIKKTLTPQNLVLLNGSATKKLILELEKIKFWGKDKKIILFETLEECTEYARNILHDSKGALLFSPGAASFEKFKNEFDRGNKWNAIIQKI